MKRFALVAVIGTFAAVSTAFGIMADNQQAPPPGPPQGGRGEMRGPMGPGFGGPGFGRGMGPHEVVTNAPYSATFTDTRTEKLQDGTVLTHTITRVVARDSQGRTREEITMSPRGKKGATADKHTEGVIFDPVAQTITRWNDSKKEVHVMQLPAFAGRGGRGPEMAGGQRGPGGPGGQGPQSPRGPREGRQEGPEREGNSFASTDLGSKMMDGVSVTGRRVTHTISAGAMGNEKEIVTSHETWYSPDLKTLISASDSDPFHGSHTLTTTNLKIGEPAANLFKAPEGYAVIQQQPRQGVGPGRGFGPRRGPGSPQGPRGPQEQQAPPPPAGEI